MSGGIWGVDEFGRPTVDRDTAADAEVARTAGNAALGVAKGIFDVVDYPRKVAAGESAVFNPETGHVSDEALKWANDQAVNRLPTRIPASAGEAVFGAGPIRAYHGSPHDFDRFDLSKIGTGEGAQSYGHGLYFAENPKTAESYRQTLADWPTTIRGMLNRDLTDDAIGALQRMRAAHPDDLPRAAKLAQWQSPDLRGIPHAELEGMLGQIAARDRPGRMYEVAIHADPERFLDWDKPLAQQSSRVVDAIRGMDPNIDVARPGSEAYRRNIPPIPAYGISEFRERGIPGIKYLDQGSRATGNGSRNFVTFDDKMVEILRKYGLLGPLAGGAAAASMPPGTEQ